MLLFEFYITLVLLPITLLEHFVAPCLLCAYCGLDECEGQFKSCKYC